MVAGRDFSTGMGTDKDHARIINETPSKHSALAPHSKRSIKLSPGIPGTSTTPTR
jgi:hypothetical protein